MRLLRPAVLVTAAILLLGASVAQAHAPLHVPKHKVGRSTSTNWSGYAIDGSGASHVIGTWTANAVQCAAGENSWSSPWVGIDGDNSNTVEQTGTDSDCVNGVPTYYAWYEMYPKSLVQLSLPVSAGNSFTGEVTYNGNGNYTLKLTNNSTHQSFSTSQNSKKARDTSVEWIVEGPSNGLISNFGSDPFSSASATINGTAGGLSAFGSAAQPITLVNNAGTIRAQPSAVTNNGFTDTWKHG
jgi:Peptidase A4 family